MSVSKTYLESKLLNAFAYDHQMLMVKVIITLNVLIYKKNYLLLLSQSEASILMQ